jgi:hypothetical protein
MLYFITLTTSTLITPRALSDWMHDTARCLGYPSDSTCAARERAREATCGHHPRWTGLAQPGRAAPTPAIATTTPLPLASSSPARPDSSLRGSAPRPCGSTHHLPRSCGPSPRPRGSSPHPCGSTPRPCGSLFSHTWPASGSAH